MVAVMIGTCGSGARNKFCASFLGEGAAVSRPPPTPAFVSSLRGCHQSSATSFGSSSSASRDWTVVNARKNLPTGMESDRVEYLGRESASLSPQGSNSALSPSYFDNPTSPISPGEGRRGELKQCGVCGDVAKSNHFGGRSCDSCKAFFRRSVQNNAYRGFNCPYEKKCVIAKTSRKACQYCRRFHKCLAIGMEKSWVMSEAERRKMMEQRQERRIAAALQQQQQQPQQLQSTTQPLIVVAPAVASASIQGPGPTMNLVEEFVLSDEMKSEIEHIEEFYKQSYKANPYSTDIMTAKGSKGVLETWMQFCKKIGHFFSLFEDFSSLCQEDQAVLLQTAMTSAGIIMGSVTYESWIGKRKGGAAGPSIPKVSFDNIEKLVPGDLLYRVKTFFKKFQTICPDQTMAKILMLVSLYSPEMAGLKDETKVQTLQEHYINILSDYLKYKFGAKAGRMFANALVSLADVREPGMGEGSGASGSTGDFNHPSGGAGGSEGAGNREFDGVGGRGIETAPWFIRKSSTKNCKYNPALNGPPQGPSVYDSSLALVPSSRSDDDNRCRNVDGCPSPQLPFSNHFASTQGRVTNDNNAFALPFGVVRAVVIIEQLI
ncbi:HR97 [Hyalella azteca]|uniref:HR97 n=1 Tax=Hyalella azteca TaxID=294128 RepID=A0A6A0GRW0_HYAAZ|nr:HR97 [Hyalella azteca]